MDLVDSSQVEEPMLTLQESMLFTEVFQRLLSGDSLEPLLASSTMTKMSLNLPLPSTHWLISEDFLRLSRYILSSFCWMPGTQHFL